MNPLLYRPILVAASEISCLGLVYSAYSQSGLSPDYDRAHRQAVVLETWRTAQPTADDCESSKRRCRSSERCKDDVKCAGSG
jgi:hypothetical protein